ncbi:hypothetical protein P8452_52503 [Trifolium repens]|nr:hypothetical protein P8452_52503 [Trifolium repens]
MWSFSRCTAAAAGSVFVRRFPSSTTTRIYSQLHHQDDQNNTNLVSSFHQLLHHNNPTPSIIQFNKILGSLVKLNQYSIVLSLHRQMEFNGISSDLVTLSSIRSNLFFLFCICQHSKEGLSSRCHNFYYTHRGSMSQR